MTIEAHNADCLEWMRSQPAKSVQLTMCSPPYEAARTYGISFKLKGQDWVNWAVERFVECLRITDGLVCWVVEGQTRKFRYSMAPVLMMADLHRRGVHLRKPPIFKRVGIPGSVGPDWLRNDYEFCICATNGGKLPWSDNTAMGHPPKWGPGGAMSYRQSNGTRRNQWGGSENHKVGEKDVNGKVRTAKRPSHKVVSMREAATEPKARRFLNGELPAGSKLHTKNDGNRMRVQTYIPSALANPGNVVECIVGGGVMGSRLCHENEAPYPETLAEFFVRSFCPEGGTVFDPFCGSGTTLAVAKRLKRNAIGVDIRESQVALTKRRLAEVQVELIA